MLVSAVMWLYNFLRFLNFFFITPVFLHPQFLILYLVSPCSEQFSVSYNFFPEITFLYTSWWTSFTHGYLFHFSPGRWGSCLSPLLVPFSPYKVFRIFFTLVGIFCSSIIFNTALFVLRYANTFATSLLY